MGVCNKVPGKYNHGDGLRLDVSATGRAVWVARIRIEGKYTVRRLAPAEGVSEAQARKLLADLRIRVATGDVRLHKPKDEEGLASDTVGAMLKAWTDDKVSLDRARPWTPRHYDKTMGKLRKALAGIWHVRVDDLTLLQFNQHLINWVGQGHSRDTAGRVWSWVKEAWEEQVNLGVYDRCPLSRKPERLRPRRNQRRPSYGADIPALRTLYSAIERSDRARAVRQVGQLCILTGLRISEVTTIERHDVVGSEIRIPRHRMKVRENKSDLFIVPLSMPALAILNDAAMATQSNFLFPGPRTGRPISAEGVEKMYQRFTQRKHTPHGCRTSLLSWALEAGYNPIACKTLLDHTVFNDVTQRYTDVDFLEERRNILAAWGEAITGVVANNVVPLRR